MGGDCLEPDFNGNLAIVRPTICDGSDIQKWGMDGYSSIHNKSYPDRCIDGLGVTNGVNVILWDCNGADNQKWDYDDRRLFSAANVDKYVTYATDAFGCVKYAQIKDYTAGDGQIAIWGVREGDNN